MLLMVKIKIEILPQQTFALQDAAIAHQTIQRRDTIGSSILIP